MSETKFTPGPWDCIDHGVGEICVFDPSTDLAICSLDDDTGSYSYPENYSVSPVAMANAQLIAAAPDLYEMLFAAVEQARKFINGEPTEDDDHFKMWFERSESALAKARGES